MLILDETWMVRERERLLRFELLSRLVASVCIHSSSLFARHWRVTAHLEAVSTALYVQRPAIAPGKQTGQIDSQRHVGVFPWRALEIAIEMRRVGKEGFSCPLGCLFCAALRVEHLPGRRGSSRCQTEISGVYLHFTMAHGKLER